MKAEIVSVGTELLLGEIVDTNAAYLARYLASLGIDLYWVSVVGDNKARIVEVFRRAWGRSDLTVVTGGLGPTDDDLTRESIAELFGEEMVVDSALERTLRDYFAGRGVAMPERNVKQATLIPSAAYIPNPVGTAPGWWVERDGKMIAAMPGVPFEMYRMWENEVVPKLQRLHGSSTLLSRTLKVAGMGESAVEDAIKEMVGAANPTVATYAKQDGVHVRIAAKARAREEAQALIDPIEARVRSLLGTAIYGADNDTLEGVVGRLLVERRLTLALVEISTGGALSNMITGVRDKEEFFKGGMVVPGVEALLPAGSNPPRQGEDEKAVETLGEAIAEKARIQLGADIGLTTMPMGQGGDSFGSLFICLSDRGAGKSRRAPLRRAATTELKRLTCLNALNHLRLHLLQAD